MIQGRKTKTAELAGKLKEKLLSERLPKDSPVMSVRELAGHFGISTNTAARILDLLVGQGFLYHRPKRGTFIKNDPPVIPSIAYAGPMPEPDNTDLLISDASFRLMRRFSELGLEPELISYYELQHPETAKLKLRKTNGLLIHSGFIDDTTLKTLWDYPGRIVVTGNAFIEDRLPCSQVIPDYTEPLLEFDRIRRFDDYDRILIVRADHRNSAAGAETVLRVLDRLQIPEKKIETVQLKTSGSINAYLRADRYFSRCTHLPGRTLIVSLSEYFSQAIREIFAKCGQMPDILSFDNLEDYAKDAEGSPCFTSIDRRMGTTFCRALDLLCGQLTKTDGEQIILRIPAKLVIRESVKPNPPDGGKKS